LTNKRVPVPKPYLNLYAKIKILSANLKHVTIVKFDVLCYFVIARPEKNSEEL